MLTQALQDHVKQTIAPYKYPRAIEYVAQLPKTETGKLRRFALRQMAASGKTVSQARHSVCLNPGKFTDEVTDNVILPRHRRDGWLEVEIGVFHSCNGIDEEIVMSFMERSDYHCKSGLIVQGFEVRPKH